MKPLFIVNEYAGKGKTKQRWSHIQRYLDMFAIPYQVHLTSRPREAVEVAKQSSLYEYSHVIAVGGDGTVNEVVNGLCGQQAIFGVIPTGTGNDFARMLEIPDDPFLAVKKLVNGSQKTIDLLELNGKYIAGAIGIGFDGAIAEDINRSTWKKRFGTLGYVLSMLKLLRTFYPFTLYLDLDEKSFIIEHCWMVAIGNSSYYGGGMKICPDAKHDDGLLDVCIVHDLSRTGILKAFPSVFSGRHVHHPKVKYMRGQVVRVRTEPSVYIHGDGEIFGQTPGEILIHPHALNVIC
jgi:diacylglycerol kinase (ATP)